MDKANCHPSNLAALCQRCHLHFQARFRPGQLCLPGIPAPGWIIRTQGANDGHFFPHS
jgi:hypothetical protein